MPQPNPIKGVLLMIADDWSPIAGCYGNPVIRTPNIDRLAARGMRFDRAFCTTPSCAASRANILTGLYSHQHGQYGHCHDRHGFRTHEHVRSLPTILRESGIQAALAGKSHIAPESVYPFDPYMVLAPNSAPRLRKAISECLASIGDEPFYLHAAAQYPHRSGGTFKAAPDPETFGDLDDQYRPEDVIVPAWLPDLPQVRQDLAAYYTEITRFDEFVGSTLQRLEDSGRADETLVLLMSDHGMPFPGAKASPFEAGHNCPLIIAHPGGVGAGQSTRALVNWTDIMPTILEALDIPTERWPKELTGESLLPLLTTPDGPWREETYYSHSVHEITNYFPYRVLRTDRYKYVQCLAHEMSMPLASDIFESPTWSACQQSGDHGGRPPERILHHPPEGLYDLDNDPLELHNLADQTGHQELTRKYRERLLELRQQTQDPWLLVDYQSGNITKEQSKLRPLA
ncbi:sulfatase [Ruficoccus sp. ZRK36]|uniref:sulfatase family protein n=1 Tax=Ruficoccus sp. ZRK36 TaxID=2866311 RepID=UPI001C72CE7D|nr:sulfatase [Ruficoccus sp. ZRK36]QYY37239.1 sulfatase [Ruficoccus sp. ZRK36]